MEDINSKSIKDYIDTKIQYLKEHTVTDGVHSIPINDQVITLLEDIKSFIDKEVATSYSTMVNALISGFDSMWANEK